MQVVRFGVLLGQRQARATALHAEAPNAEDKEFGGARLADALRSVHTGSAREINDGILAAVQSFSGEHGLRDDYTLLTVKRIAGGSAG